MKFLERFTLITYSLIMLILSVILSLLIFNWIDFGTVIDMVESLITGSLSSKITLGVCVVFILLSIKCMFFDEKSKEVLKQTQGILLKNENVVIKELASNLQTKIKDEVKKVSDLDVQEVNVKVMSIQENKKGKEKE